MKSQKANISQINAAATSGLPVLIKKSAIITPVMVVAGVNGRSNVTTETVAMGLGGMAGVENATGNTGSGLKWTGL